MAKKVKQSAFRGKIKSDASRQKTASSSYGYLNLPKGMQVYSPTPGSKESFDIIPYVVLVNNHPDKNTEAGIAVKGELWYKRPFKSHRSVGSDNDSVVCLASFGKKCPICEYRKQLIKEGADETLIKELKPSNRNLYFVIPRGIKKLEEEVHVLDFSQWNFQNLLNDEIEENEEYEIFPDFDEGLTLKVRWDEKTFMKNTFAEASRIDFIERDEAIPSDIIDDLPSLDEILQELSYEALYAKFHEIEMSTTELEEEEDEDDTPKKKPAAKKPAAKKVVEDEEEEEEEEDEIPTWEDLVGMVESKLIKFCKENNLETDPDDYDDDVTSLRKAIAAELEIEVPKKVPVKKEVPVKKKPVVEEEEEEEEEEEAPKKKSVNKGVPASSSKKNKCPNGYRFGTDNDNYEECDGCPLWDACLDAQ